MTTIVGSDIEKIAVKYIKIKRAMEQLKDALEPLTEQIKESGVPCIETSAGDLHIMTSTRTSLDLKAVVDKLGQPWVTKHSRVTEFPVIRISK